VKGGPDERSRPEFKAEPPPEPPTRPVSETNVAVPVAADAVNPEEALLAKIKADPRRPDAYLLLAGRYRRNDQLDEAREILTEGLARTGNDFELAIELADLEAEPFRQNLAIVEARLRDQPDDESLRKLRIRLLKEINTRELYLYRQQAERYPTDLAYRYEFGLRLLRAGQLDEAICELQAARADTRYQWRALVYLGYAFKNRNNWRLAQRNFEEALQCVPAGEDTYRKELLFLLAQGAADAGDLAKALERAEELAHLDFVYRDIGRLMDEWQARLNE
jgi:tetratricopeptide (TPR) repeat protein